MPICGIYKITNQLNGHAYIGLSIDIERRSKEHRKMKYRACIYDAFVKYGIDNFKFTILEECQKDKLNEQEKYWIAYYNSVEEGYNTKDGGQTIVVTDKFLEQCGSYPFYAFDLKGNKLGEFLNQREFSRQYGVGKGDIYRMLHNQAHYCNGVICIDKETFTEKRLQECIKQAQMKATPFIARNIETGEVFGPFTNKTECKKTLGLKSNHISEVLEKKRKTQEGYTFVYCKGEE